MADSGGNALIAPNRDKFERVKNSDGEYEDSYAEPPDKTQVGSQFKNKDFLLEKKKDQTVKAKPMTKSEKRRAEADPHGVSKKPIMATNKEGRMRPGMENRTIEQ